MALTKIFLLALALAISRGQICSCYFFGRWDTQPATSPAMYASDHLPVTPQGIQDNTNEVRASGLFSGNWQHQEGGNEGHVAMPQGQGPIHNIRGVGIAGHGFGGSVPLPLHLAALQFPHQIGAIALIPAFHAEIKPVPLKSPSAASPATSSSPSTAPVASLAPVSFAFTQNHHHQIGLNHPLKHNPSEQGLADKHFQQPFHLLQLQPQSLLQPQQVSPLYEYTSQSNLQGVQFVPCLCNERNHHLQQRWPKISTNVISSSSPTGMFQAIHMLPCYCPILRDIEGQYPQIVSQPVSVEKSASTAETPSSTSSLLSKV